MTFSFRRVVTGHDERGRAVVRRDHRVSAEPRLPGYHAKVVWATSSFPPSNDEAGFDDGMPGPPGARVLFRVGELVPGESDIPNMHRTETQDVALILSGELDLVLDSGEVVERLTAGDFVVQRGTMHSWVVRGDEPVRVLFVLMDAPPARVGDIELREDISVFGGAVSPMPTAGQHG
ncbi:cupin domain-containing protein [Nocardioides sp. QY071]|uniref:cupin domain-containing protein n=1 Tax=Nocardioides sp. QY071 TaxID=3044187 RepID=UPI00249AAD90|nr:cupin domain-containing protein [Nocardioides sp. QY071]WGY00469.1 cupin domain-containing protein [Nocardioides sp. QY071]